MEFPAIKKLAGTVDTIVKLAEGIPTYNINELNAAEDRLRNEFQVVEAHLFHVGQEVYEASNARRLQLRREHILNVDNVIKDTLGEEPSKEAPKKTTKKGKK